MASEAILSTREFIKREMKGIDNSCKVSKTINLATILSKIENDTSLDDKEINKLYNIWFNSAILYARRKNPGLLSFFNTNKGYISDLIYKYKLTYSTVYKVDDSLLDWWFDLSTTKLDTSPIKEYYKAGEGYLLEYNNKVYSLMMHSGYYIISSIDRASSLYYVCNCSEDGYKYNICCNNTACPHYKSSMQKAYKDNTKDVFCTLDDLRKCNQCKESGVAHPFDIEFLFEGVAYVLMHRDYPIRSSSNRDDYEHLPKPERVDDVTIYFGERKLTPLADKVKSPIPSSHASPREHTRRGGVRRAYTRKDGTKVRATTFKGTVVNKGHTKTSYKFKEVEKHDSTE